MVDKTSKILVLGSTGMVGSAVIRSLRRHGYKNIIETKKDTYDLTHQHSVVMLFHETKPDYVINCAAKVGGIQANIDLPATFIYDNIAIATNVIHTSFLFKVKKLLNLGSSCIYPKEVGHKLQEEDLLTGPLESTNESYAVAKIAAVLPSIKLTL